MPGTPFLNMFGRSPIRPLEAHMSKVHACVNQLNDFFSAVFAKDWEKAEKYQRDIVRLENEADDIKRDLRLHLPKSLFMPVPRGDVLDLLNVQDRLANKSKDIAGVILGRKMEFPEQLIPLLQGFLKRSIDASSQANTAIHELDELYETSFSGSEIKLVEDMITKLSHIEHETDEKQIHLRHLLFDLENTLQPIPVIFLYKIIEWIGELADGAREVGNRLQILIAR